MAKQAKCVDSKDTGTGLADKQWAVLEPLLPESPYS